jgi:hypothetical protein
MNTGAKQRISPAAIILTGHAKGALPATKSGREQNSFAYFYALAEFTHPHYFAGDVTAKNMRHGVLQSAAGANPQIQVIQRAGAYPQEYFIGFDRGLRNIFVAENFRTAVFVDSDSFHKWDRRSYFVVCPLLEA